MPSYPGSIYSPTNPSPTSPRNSPSLAGEVSGLNNEVVAIETALGTNLSAVKAYVQSLATSYNALNYGVVADGVTDDTAAWNALFVTIAGLGGGIAFLPGGLTSRCNGALTPMPFGAACPYLRLTGAGSFANGTWASSQSGASKLDLRYNGAANTAAAKIDCRGVGRFELDHLSLISGGTDNYPFFQTTNTTVYIHDNYVAGHSANSGASCVQDAFVLGGATPGGSSFPWGIQTGASTAPFQGYGTVIERNAFDKIRTGVLCHSAANANTIASNVWNTNCGGDATHGAIHFVDTVPDNALSPNGNLMVSNTIEAVNYVYPVYFGTGAANNIGVSMGIFDAGVGTLASFLDASTSALGPNGTTGNRFYGTNAIGLDQPDQMSLHKLTVGTTSFTPTASGEYLLVMVGGGGSGGAGGTSAGAANQVAGGGGAQGQSYSTLAALQGGTTYVVAVGTGGAATATTAAGGHTGANGTSGVATTFVLNGFFTFLARGGVGGIGGAASTPGTDTFGGAYTAVAGLVVNATFGGTSPYGAISPDGCGGSTLINFASSGSGGSPVGLGAGGGGAGGNATPTNGGTGGQTGNFNNAAAGGMGSSGTVNGGAGSNSSAGLWGGGGGGGGAGAAGTGTGGAGGKGGDGAIFVIGPFS